MLKRIKRATKKSYLIMEIVSIKIFETYSKNNYIIKNDCRQIYIIFLEAYKRFESHVLICITAKH